MFNDKIKILINKIKRKMLKRLSLGDFKELMFLEIERRMVEIPPSDALKFLFEIDNRLYGLEGQLSINYGNGLHTKHKHMKYHDFFIENIKSGSRVLDIGCGNGALSADIADKVDHVYVYGIDISEANIQAAKSIYKRNNIKYICGDALNSLPDEEFGVIVLSNVLEHIEKRILFLKSLNEKYKPNSFLIRVPCFERDWRVPLKKEIGMDYRLDKTHYIEYRYIEFKDEIKRAGLIITSSLINWGEIWAVVENKK